MTYYRTIVFLLFCYLFGLILWSGFKKLSLTKKSPRRQTCRCMNNSLKDDLNSEFRQDTPLVRSILDRNNFREDLVDCSNFVFQDLEKFKEHRAGVNSTTCTLQVFREYFKGKNRFYGEGTWYVPKAETPEGAIFQPDHCIFDEKQTTNDNFKNCLMELPIRKITVFGDSNGFRIFQAVLKFLQKRSTVCNLLKQEKELDSCNSHSYFSIPGKPPVKTFRKTLECQSQVYKCELTDTLAVDLEFIEALHLMDGTFEEEGNSLKTFTEFLLRRYFKHTGNPEIWIVSAPVFHEVENSVSSFKESVSNFADLLDIHLPSATRAVIVPATRFCPVLSLPSDWGTIQDFRLLHGGLSRNKRMHVMNQVLFDRLRKYVIRGGNMRVHGYLDFDELSCPFTCIWHEDEKHMKVEWYSIMIDLLVQYLCAMPAT